MWPLLRATHACCAKDWANGGKKTLLQMSLGERGAIPDHILSPASCSHVNTQAGSSFALQELVLGDFVPKLAALLFTWCFSLQIVPPNYV